MGLMMFGVPAVQFQKILKWTAGPRFFMLGLRIIKTAGTAVD